MAIKKSALYNSLWKSCDELRGGMDASQYKDYVLTLLFVKYVSDRYSEKQGSLLEIPEGGSFKDLIELKGDKEIGDKFNKVISKLAEPNGLKGVIDIADFNDEDKLGKGKEMQDRLSKLVSIFNDLDFSGNRADGDDLLGDAYEYLMRHFATESGKSKGQFYTPSEVSRIMAKVIGISKETRQDQTVYDPTCGSGSLLLKASDEAPNGMSIYGQEKDVATTALARMNMILHDNPTAEIASGGDSTLAKPAFTKSPTLLKAFDFVVANPPFSTKSWSNGFNPQNDEFGRFDLGIPPSKNGDYSFLLHIIRSLKNKGKGAVILPHGVLFRGNAEGAIRKKIIELRFIKGIIGMPANLFYGTGIPACIIVLDKEHSASRKGIFMIDASKSFVKDGNKNRLRSQDIHKIVDVFTKQIEITGYSRLVPTSEITDSKNGYNLNIPRYIDSNDQEDIHDLTAHLKGGIPKNDIDALENYWDVFKTVRHQLFAENVDPNYVTARIESADVKSAILDSDEYTIYAKAVADILSKWQQKHKPSLINIAIGIKPSDIIHNISEDLLQSFANIPLLDKYDIYQHLMSYWSEIMQDDVYQIAAEGWKEAAQIRLIVDDKDKDKKTKVVPDITIGNGKNAKKFKAELIPPHLIVASYFAKDMQGINKLETEKEALSQTLEELVEEHSGEEGLIEDAKNDKGKISKASLKDRIKEIKGDAEFADEMELLKQCQKLLDDESSLASEVKDKQIELDKQIIAHYAKLSEEEIKTLVVQNKWFATLEQDIIGEVERVTQSLASRVKELEERYNNPLPKIIDKVEDYSQKVEQHLKKMGLSW